MKSVCYIAHCVDGDPDVRLECLKKISRDLALLGDVIPFVPEFGTQYLNSKNPNEVRLGMSFKLQFLRSGVIDYLYLYGSHLDIAQKQLIYLAWDLGIKVESRTEGTKRDLQQLAQEYG